MCALQASQIQTKSLDALAKQREGRLALISDKIMEQKYLAIQEQLERLKVKEAELLEQQTVLNDSIAAYENLNLELEEQKKSQVTFCRVWRENLPLVSSNCNRQHGVDALAGSTRAAARRNGPRYLAPHEVSGADVLLGCFTTLTFLFSVN